MLKNIIKPELYEYLGNLLDKHPDYATTNIPLPEGDTPAEDLHRALEHNNLTIGWIPSHPVCLYHSTGDEVVPFQNYQIAAANLGDHVMFYPSPFNSTHISTAMEFFISTQRTECIRMLATSESGIHSITAQNAKKQKYYDLQGRPITGTPTHKGIYITGGKKIVVR